MTVFLYGGGLTFALSLVVGVLFARGRRRLLVSVALGVVLALLYFPIAYALAGEEPGACSDCGHYLGRWWEPWFVALIAAWNYVVWLAGLIMGAAARHLRNRLAAVSETH